MGEQPVDSGSRDDTPRIDRPILEDIRDRLRTATQFDSVEIVTATGQTRLEAVIDSALNPLGLDRRFLDIRWYTNDDFRIHYREAWEARTWQQRWDRHPNEYNTRDHFHPPPDAATPGEDRSWPADYRDVLANVLAAVTERNDVLWAESSDE